MQNCLCAKEVGALLGVSTRTAQALMKSGQIESFRVGQKLLRTTPAKLEAYQARQCAALRPATFTLGEIENFYTEYNRRGREVA